MKKIILPVRHPVKPAVVRCLVLAATVLLSQSSPATIFLAEEYPTTYGDGTRLGNDQTAGGYNVKWPYGNGIGNGSPTNTSAGALSYSGLAPISGSASHGVRLATATTKNSGAALSGLASGDGTSLYLSFLIKVTATTPVERPLFGFRVSTGGGTGHGVGINASRQLWIMKNATTAGATHETALTADTTCLVVFRYKYQSGSDEAALWLNPATGQADESGAGVTPLTLSTGSDASGAFTNLLLYGTVADTSGPLYVDEIRVADSWAEVTPSSGPPPRDLTWDADNGTAGAQDGGGTWDNENNNPWWTGAANMVWSNALPDRATIGAGDGAAGIITVSGIVTNSGLVFAAPGSGNYTLSGGTLHLTGGVTNHADAIINSVIAGAALVKYGSHALTLGGDNTYAGATTIGAGTLKLGAAGVIPDGSGKGDVTVTGTLDLNGNSEGINGLSGAGTVTNSGAAATLTVGNNSASGSFAGVAADDGTAKLAITKTGSGIFTLGGGGNNTCSGTTTVSEGALNLGMTAAGLNAFGGDLTINGGAVAYSAANNNQIPDTATVTISSGAIAFGARSEAWGSFYMSGGALTMSSGTITNLTGATISGGTVTISSSGTFLCNTEFTFGGGTVVFSNSSGSAARINLRGGDGTGITYPSSGTAAAGIIGSGGGNNGVSLNGGATTVFTIQDSPAVATELSIAVPMTGAGTAAVRKEGGGTLLLTATNTYTGNTTINGGTLALSGPGSITSSPIITVASGATLDVSGLDAPFTLLTNQTLTGNGAVKGTLVVAAGATVAPGTPIGTLTLTVSNSPTLNGTLEMEINPPSSADKLVVGGKPLSYGGTLTVTNIGGALMGGEVFKLFDASGFSGSFATVNLPAHGSGKNWYTNDLTIDGTILLNRAPTATSPCHNRPAGLPFTVAINDLGTDPDDGQSVFLAGSSGTTTNGAVLTNDATHIHVPAGTGDDSFDYTIHDGHGGTNVGTVLLMAATGADGRGGQTVATTHGTVIVSFAGASGREYIIQRSTNLVEGSWVNIATNLAPGNGLFEVTDAFDDLGGTNDAPSSAFYRLRSP